jgi:hypothetical protein
MTKKIIVALSVPENVYDKMNEQFINKLNEISKIYNKEYFNIEQIKYISDDDIIKSTDNTDVQLGMKTLRDIIFN